MSQSLTYGESAERSSKPLKLAAVRHSSWSQLAQRFASSTVGQSAEGAAATPFQAGNWLRAWYDTIGAQPGITPMPLEICDASSGAPLFGVPLIKRQVGTLQIVEFADLQLTDYNAPLIGYAKDGTPPAVSPRALLTLLRSELGGCDQLRFTKLPAQLVGAPNPFAALPGNRPSEFGTNVVSIGEDWAEYHRTLAKKVRKELERSFRVFQRDGSNAEFRVVRDPAEAIAVLERMELLQAQRMQELGLPYLLNEPQYAAFYRRLIELDFGNGQLLLSVLKSDPDELVGALLGLVDGNKYAMVRLAHAGKAWAQCSPGKLMIDQTMAHLHARGVRKFDFTTGDYGYKRSFLVEREPLVDVTRGLSLRGNVTLAGSAVAQTLKGQLRRSPKLYAAFKRMRG